MFGNHPLLSLKARPSVFGDAGEQKTLDVHQVHTTKHGEIDVKALDDHSHKDNFPVKLIAGKHLFFFVGQVNKKNTTGVGKTIGMVFFAPTFQGLQPWRLRSFKSTGLMHLFFVFLDGCSQCGCLQNVCQCHVGVSKNRGGPPKS